MSRSRTFLITGVSSGLGRAVAEAALAAGHTVVGTVRREADAEAFAASSERAVARLLDVTDDAAVFATVGEVLETVGLGRRRRRQRRLRPRGHARGVVDAGAARPVRRQRLRRRRHDQGGAAVDARAALGPRRRDHLDGRAADLPGLSFYHGSKYAMEGILESLAREVADLGVHVTAVAPGGFRTDWAGRSMVRTRSAIADYRQIVGPLSATREANSGRQLGDPARAAQAILTIVEAPEPPRHLLLGSDALRLVAQGREELQRDIDAWEALSRTTDIEGAYQIAS